MKNFRLLFVFALAGVFAASCVKNGGEQGPVNNDPAAYMAVTVKMAAQSRASSETPGEEAESVVHSLYFITFDDAGDIIGVPGTSAMFSLLTDPEGEPDAVKVSVDATRLLLIANPGEQLLGAINALTAQSNFADLNEAIYAQTTASIVDMTAGFAMISAGDQTGLAADDVISEPFVDISTSIVPVTTTEAAAKAQAEQNRVSVSIERLAAKLVLAPAESITVITGGSFEFVEWTLDAVNSVYFPFAEKTLGATTHTVGNYLFNFYTQDPNFNDNSDIEYGFVMTGTNEIVLAQDYEWIAGGETQYCIENTMEAEDQLIQNATRIVIRALYAPAGFTLGDDWFSFAGTNYQTLGDLQSAYVSAGAGSDLALACDAFFLNLSNYFTNNGLTLNAAIFSELTVTELALVNNGGEISKGGVNDQVLLWYPGSLNYYRYEVRHDNEADAFMAFGKYGVVRNNQYQLTLNSVGGAGTPWYPDINNPGPGDPLPTDPIDVESGFLGIEVGVANWILWETGFGI